MHASNGLRIIVRAVSLTKHNESSVLQRARSARIFGQDEACLVPVHQPSKCHSMALLHWHVQSSCAVGEDDSERVAGWTDGSDATLFVSTSEAAVRQRFGRFG